MNKNELVEAVARRVGDKRMAAASVEAVLDTVMRTVTEGEKVALSGFGVFEKADRAARSARNPATGGTVELAATSVPRFRAGQVFKGVVSGARDLPPLPEPASPAEDELVDAGSVAEARTGEPVRRRPRVARTAGAGTPAQTSPLPAGQDERSADDELTGDVEQDEVSAGDQPPGDVEQDEGSAGDQPPGDVEQDEGSADDELTGDVDAGAKGSDEEDAGKDSAGKDSAGKDSAGQDSAGKKGAAKGATGKKDAGKKDAGKKDAGKKDAGKKDAGKKGSAKKADDKKAGDKKSGGKGATGKKRARA